MKRKRIDELVEQLKENLPGEARVSYEKTKHSRPHYYIVVKISYKWLIQSEYANETCMLTLGGYVYGALNPIIANMLESNGLRKFVKVLYYCDHAFILMSPKDIFDKIKGRMEERNDIIIYSHGDCVHDMKSGNYRDRDYNIHGFCINMDYFRYFLTGTPV